MLFIPLLSPIIEDIDKIIFYSLIRYFIRRTGLRI